MVKGRNIHKHFNKLHVLKGVDIDITEGEFVSIVGDSGAGKTTLLHILGTLEPPTHNLNSELYISGVDIRKLDEISLANFRNENIGFIFQFHHLLPEFTAIENVCIPGFIANKSKKDVETKALQLLTRLGLEEPGFFVRKCTEGVLRVFCLDF